MVERHFDEELKELNSKLLKIAALTEDSIKSAIEALKKKDKDLARKVLENDEKIDAFELAIDDYSIELLAKRQPLASDLRFITTGMKINAELERIADLAVNISHRVIDIADQPMLKQLIDIPALSELAIIMVKESIDAFVNRSIDCAEKVIQLDCDANALRTKIQKELVDDYMKKDPNTISRAISLFLVAQHLERICDHAKYIAQDVYFLVSAKDVRHRVCPIK
jgi:phosphate transport system protein